MKCNRCGEIHSLFKEVEFQTIDGVVKKRRIYCILCFDKMYSKSVHKVIRLCRDEEREM